MKTKKRLRIVDAASISHTLPKKMIDGGSHSLEMCDYNQVFLRETDSVTLLHAASNSFSCASFSVDS